MTSSTPSSAKVQSSVRETPGARKSSSTRQVFCPDSARHHARLMEVSVLPSPGLGLVTSITPPCGCRVHNLRRRILYCSTARPAGSVIKTRRDRLSDLSESVCLAAISEGELPPAGRALSDICILATELIGWA